MTIRPYEPRDLGEIIRLFNDYRVFYEQDSDIKLAERFIRERIESDESLIFVADAGNNALVGFCQLYPTFCSVAAAPIYVLYDLFVSPTVRRQGIAKQLLQAAAYQAKVDGKARIDLTTGKQNVNAQALYEMLGWKRDERFYTYNLTIA
ncbi:GNAT family N-acetyltransferase [Ralstonia pseudosolanacearum]|uniref:GNAT family N-acetyltransferase n=1 Tax=Ralstonia pseudosolanacearum TaxID=1310165 RepID=UPI000CE3138C|nr:GNAT family N-acetyltransferase [Ralstonia pseudosolanacearum]BCL92276.1 putative N-acetyltransferase YhfO [Ralstonia solanacearum]BCL97375.1 putative N-acetyltransferase YhfO [Ralstonia solanacearum]BCM12750.1 putative N-acetyltransferase YhfO [Ralstonia solanacearum]BCN04841.1 putative N-acetyltransferase YhfO [Ralstonia solanacearum]BCN09830.1 putative N-acetyltransferase YhfO [Ralstonia solanacearum]